MQFSMGHIAGNQPLSWRATCFLKLVMDPRMGQPHFSMWVCALLPLCHTISRSLSQTRVRFGGNWRKSPDLGLFFLFGRKVGFGDIAGWAVGGLSMSMAACIGVTVAELESLVGELVGEFAPLEQAEEVRSAGMVSPKLSSLLADRLDR